MLGGVLLTAYRWPGYRLRCVALRWLRAVALRQSVGQEAQLGFLRSGEPSGIGRSVDLADDVPQLYGADRVFDRAEGNVFSGYDELLLLEESSVASCFAA